MSRRILAAVAGFVLAAVGSYLLADALTEPSDSAVPVPATVVHGVPFTGDADQALAALLEATAPSVATTGESEESADPASIEAGNQVDPSQPGIELVPIAPVSEDSTGTTLSHWDDTDGDGARDVTSADTDDVAPAEGAGADSAAPATGTGPDDTELGDSLSAEEDTGPAPAGDSAEEDTGPAPAGDIGDSGSSDGVDLRDQVPRVIPNPLGDIASLTRGPAPIRDRAIDTCADGGPGCPVGVGGVMGVDLPVDAFYAEVTLSPPECAGAGLGRPDTAVFGLRMTAPAVVRVGYVAARSVADADPTIDVAIPAEAESDWFEWAAEPEPDRYDPRRFIDHCFVLINLEAGWYRANFSFDEREGSAAFLPPEVAFKVTLPGPFSGSGTPNRPTQIIPTDLDTVFVSYTRKGDQEVRIVAYPRFGPSNCHAPSVAAIGSAGPLGGEVGRNAVLVRSEEIRPETLAQPDYPWRRDHTHNGLAMLRLSESESALVCIYWIGSDSSALAGQIERHEVGVAHVPAAHRPTVSFLGIENIVSPPSFSANVTIPGCGARRIDVTDSGRVSWRGFHRWCTIDSGLGDIEQSGLLIQTAVTLDDGTTTTMDSRVKFDLACRTDGCAERASELVTVHLPTTGVRGAPASCSSGCVIGPLPAARAVFRIDFTPGSDTAVAEWLITQPTEAGLPRLSEELVVAVSVDQSEERPGIAQVSFDADRPVKLKVDDIQRVSGDPSCPVGAIERFSSTGFSSRHFFRVEGLCDSTRYRVFFEAVDGSGAQAANVENGESWFEIDTTS